jgi:hypothetical protein
MKPNESIHFLVKITYIILLVLLLPGCNLLATAPTPTPVLENPPGPLAPTETAALPTATSAPASTPTTAAPTATAVPDAASVSVSFGGLEMNFTIQVVEAVPPGPDVMGHMVMPKHLRLELQNYAITKHLKKPQFYVYVVEELAINEAAAQSAASLQTLLQDPQAALQMSQEQDLPFLPLINEAQMLHAQVQFVDFKNGQGVRYVTQYSQGLTPGDELRAVLHLPGSHQRWQILHRRRAAGEPAGAASRCPGFGHDTAGTHHQLLQLPSQYPEHA